MNDNELLEAVKTRLGITGTYHDALITGYCEDVKAFMISGGVPDEVADSEEAVGCIARGVADLWNYGAGDGKFSEVFWNRVIQLSMATADENEG